MQLYFVLPRPWKQNVLKLLGATVVTWVLFNIMVLSNQPGTSNERFLSNGVVIGGRHYQLIDGKPYKRNIHSSNQPDVEVEDDKGSLGTDPGHPSQPTTPPAHQDAFIHSDKHFTEENVETYKKHRVLYKRNMISESKSTIHKAPWGQMNVCINKTYDDIRKFGKVSVIIAFHDHESASLILHTVHSVLQRTPRVLLKEIILIDDATHKDDLKQLLETYVRTVFDSHVVRIHRSDTPLGLIKARNLGAKMAAGDVIVCMDSHMEVQRFWLEALLEQIYINPKTLATSYLDWFEHNGNSTQWVYSHGGRDWVTFFDWQLIFGFQQAGTVHKVMGDPTAPVMSMVTVGTIWAMKRDWFFEIGALDDGMKGWGGENLDLAIRTWLFGGRVINVPCSHAAHYEKKGYRDYRKGWEPMFHRNYKRVTEVWFDDYKDIVYYYMPHVKAQDAGDITARLSLKSRALHDMKWFLDNLYPELNVPHRDSFAWGGVINEGTGTCIEAMGTNTPSMYPCGAKPNKQNIMWNKNGELRFSTTVLNTIISPKGFVLKSEGVIPVFNSLRNKHWIHWRKGPIMEFKEKLCLDASPADGSLVLAQCNFVSSTQQWTFLNYTSAYWNLVKPVTDQQEAELPTVHRAMRRVASHLKEHNWVNLYSFLFPSLAAQINSSKGNISATLDILNNATAAMTSRSPRVILYHRATRSKLTNTTAYMNASISNGIHLEKMKQLPDEKT